MARKSARSEALLKFLNKGPSKKVAWFVGLIFGDGNVTMAKKGNRVSAGVCGQIRDRLMEVVPFGEYKSKKSEDFYNIYVDGKDSAQWFLDNFGICGPKSSTIRFPEIYKTNNLGWHFIRGFFDADGTVHTNLKPKKGHPKITFGLASKSEKFLDDVANYMAVNSDVDREAMRIDPSKKVMNGDVFVNYTLKIKDQPSVKIIYENLYKIDSQDFFMERKRSVFKNFYASNHEYGRTYKIKEKEICVTGKPVLAHGVSRILYDRYSRLNVLNILKKRGDVPSDAYKRFLEDNDASKLNQFLKNNLISYYVAKHDGFMSPAEAWNGKTLENNLSRELTDVRRDRFEVKPASWFRLQDAIMIIDKMKSEYGIKKIIDPFSGWGVRLTASLLMDMTYYGVDANKILQYEMKSITRDLDNKNFFIGVDNSFEHDFPDGYDAVFSCPPYWDAEDYNYKIRSIRKYSTFLTYLVRLTNRLWTDSMKVIALSVESFSYRGVKYNFHEDLPERLIAEGYKITPWVYRQMYRSFNNDYRDLNVFFVTK